MYDIAVNKIHTIASRTRARDYIDMFFINGRPVAGSFYYSVFQGICVGLGYTLAMLLMSGIRERLDLCNVPKALKDFPLAFIIAAIMSLSFLGFNGFRF